jgi:hypothetical protein
MSSHWTISAPVLASHLRAGAATAGSVDWASTTAWARIAARKRRQFASVAVACVENLLTILALSPYKTGKTGKTGKKRPAVSLIVEKIMS